MHRIPRYDIYTDRRNERALCQDFPADEALIHGLHLMQAYLRARGATIDIPVVRVMNTAHYLATYMLSTPCTDQTEYDMRVYCDLGCDKRLASIAIIALAAMLQRIDNPRAKTCRSALLEDRSDDFYEGLSMYEQWLAAVCDRDGKSEHYSDEDFQIDVMDELNAAKQQIQYLQNKLQNQLTMKEEAKQPVTNIFNGPYIANNYVQDGGKQILSAENVYWSDNEKPEIGVPDAKPQIDSATILPLPHENNYSEVRKYIEERKRFDEDFKTFCLNHTLRDLCSKLTDIFGWYVEENSLGKNLNRHNRT